MSEDDATEDGEKRLTRREAMSAGGAVAGAALVSKYSTRPAVAQTGTEPRIQLGDDWEIDDVDRGDGTTDLQLKHLPSGVTFEFDGADNTSRLPPVETSEVTTGTIVDSDDGTSYDVGDDLAGGGGALSDAGTDNADGGDQYVLPQTEDSIDLQGAGDIENAASVTTGDLDIELDGADDTYEDVIQYPTSNVDDIQDETRVTRGVSTTATEIARVSGPTVHAIVMVQGSDDTNNAAFYDVVAHARESSPVVISSQGYSSPSTRTYSRDVAALDLSMSADTYDIRTRSFENGGIPF